MAPQGTVDHGDALMSVKWRSVTTRIRDVLKPSGQTDDPRMGSTAGLGSASEDSRSLRLPKAKRSRECFPPMGNQAKTPGEARTEPRRRPWSGVAVARAAEPSRADSLTQMPARHKAPALKSARSHGQRHLEACARGAPPEDRSAPGSRGVPEVPGSSHGRPVPLHLVPHISVQSAHTWVPPWASFPSPRSLPWDSSAACEDPVACRSRTAHMVTVGCSYLVRLPSQPHPPPRGGPLTPHTPRLPTALLRPCSQALGPQTHHKAGRGQGGSWMPRGE